MRRILLSLSLLLLVPLLTAPHYTNWHAFSNGAVADAGQVNENFVAAAAALDDFETRVSALEAAAQMFLTTDACPAGYNAVEDGYIKLGSPAGSNIVVQSRTLVSRGHGHNHTLQTPSSAGHPSHAPLLVPGQPQVFSLGGFGATGYFPTVGAHTHGLITGTVGAYHPQAGGGCTATSEYCNGDITQPPNTQIQGHLAHIVLRLCVRTQ